VTRPDTAALAGPPAGIVDVWCVPLRLPALARDRLARLLSVEERTQVARMRVGGEAWSAAHAALRLILAHYLGTPPEALRIERGRLGKPRLASGHGPYFNLSRREELALVAVASDREVGVDLERQDDATRIERTYRFKNFGEALGFVERAGALAEAEFHHPDISFGWGYATVSLRTKKIKGLHENDFIMAAKLDRIAAERAKAQGSPA